MEYSKSRRRLCVYDKFGDFRELMVKLSGVIQMVMLTKGDQKIFMIGERHGTDFCRDKGYKPLCQIIREYLLYSPTRTDFMLEQDSNKTYPKDIDMGLYNALVERKENTAFKTHDGTVHKPLDIMNLTRVMTWDLSPKNPDRLRVQNTRVHWLDPNINKLKEGDDDSGDALVYWFDKYVASHDINDLEFRQYMHDKTEGKQELSKHAENNQALRDECVAAIRRIVHNSAFTKKPFSEITDKDKVDFLDACMEKVWTAKHFRNCSSQKRLFDTDVYRSTFRDFYKSFKPQTEDWFYISMHRFLMDIYTCCRLMKKDKLWYKKIVLYAGNAHVINCSSMLQKVGYELHPVTGIEYNPTCTKDGP